MGDLTINGGDAQRRRHPRACAVSALRHRAAVDHRSRRGVALNPWSRLGLDVALHIPKTLRLLGRDVQISQGTPIGLGDINLRVGGDLYLYKDPGQPLSVTGSLDCDQRHVSVSGAPVRSRPGDQLDQFPRRSQPRALRERHPGDLRRVDARGDHRPMRSPELRLSSTPPLDPSDILSLIVFNTSANDLTAPQQQELAVRAGAIAAGFLATPLISASQRTLGLDILEIDPTGERGQGPRVTIAEQLAPGLVARFSRQFGGPDRRSDHRILRSRGCCASGRRSPTRLRSARASPFRRVERAGIDLLLFFSLTRR